MVGIRWLVLDAQRRVCILPPSENVQNYKTSWVIHAAWLPSSATAAERPGLGNKLVSFNIRNWWKAISRSVKMGLKGLCRRWAQSVKTAGGVTERVKQGFGGALKQEQDETPWLCSAAKASGAEPQTANTTKPHCQWTRERGRWMEVIISNLEKHMPATILSCYI